MTNRHAEEFLHLGVMLGIPGEVRVAPQVGDSDRFAVPKQDAKHSMESRQVANAAGQALADADGDELVEAAVAVWDSKGSVMRAGELASGAKDALEDAVEVEVAGQRQRRLVEGLHLFGAVAPAHLGIELGCARHVMAGAWSCRWPVEFWPRCRSWRGVRSPTIRTGRLPPAEGGR